MKLLKNKKGFVDSLQDWFVPALIAFILGAALMYLMYKGIIPDFAGLFAAK